MVYINKHDNQTNLVCQWLAVLTVEQLDTVVRWYNKGKLTENVNITTAICASYTMKFYLVSTEDELP